MFDTVLFIVALIVILFFIVQFVFKRKQTSNKKTSVEPMNYAEEDSNSYTSWSETASNHDHDGDGDSRGDGDADGNGRQKKASSYEEAFLYFDNTRLPLVNE